MDIGGFQIILSSMFSMMGAAAIFFIAYRAYTVGNDVAEMKKLLKDLNKPVLYDSVETVHQPARVPATPGEWPSVTDPSYNRELPYDFRPFEPLR